MSEAILKLDLSFSVYVFSVICQCNVPFSRVLLPGMCE